ncbi:MAG: GH116 family glycosyl-hydrolase [Bacteroidota bacterium]
MAAPYPSEKQTRRHFLAKTLSPLAALWLQSCAGSRPSAGTGSTSRRAPGNDHPLLRLSYPKESFVSREMRIEQVDTPVWLAEGHKNWHQKGAFPYTYRVNTDAKSVSWADAQGKLHTPPAGLRSSTPLGGIGTGTLELRADGRLADWQILNNSPGGGNKFDIDDAFFAIRTQLPGSAPHAVTMRTHPPAELPAVRTLGYSSAFPVTRLRPVDDAIPLNVSLHAHGLVNMVDPTLAALPGVVFSFQLHNPTREPVETAVMFNLPNFIEGTFRTERGLVLSRSGQDAAAGELCIGFSSNLAVSSMVSADLDELWETFSTQGHFEGTTSMGLFEHGAVASNLTIAPGASRAVTLILSWRFPNRFVGVPNVGNAYARRFSTASSVSDTIVNRLPVAWRAMQAWNDLFTRTTLPPAVQVGLRDSIGQLYKTSFCAVDGRWRMWDAFADAGLSSLDTMLYRALPLLLLDHTMLKSVLRAYAFTQDASGRINDTLGEGSRLPMDASPAPTKSTSNAAFFILASAYVDFTGDMAFLKEMWPHLLKAMNWQLSITTPEGLPSNLPALNDWQFDEEGVLLHDALLHLAGLHGLSRMARMLDRETEVTQLAAVLKTGISGLESLLGSPSGYKISTARTSPATASDPNLLIGLLWADLLGLSPALDPEQRSALLKRMADTNAPPISIKQSDATQQTIAPAMVMNWAAASIQSGRRTSDALAPLEQLLNHQQAALADGFGFYERLSIPAGQPYSTPNHASHLAIWFVVVALSGQYYDGFNQKLRFTPRVGNGARLPFFTPTASGLLTIQKSGKYTLEVIAGRLELRQLEIGDSIVYRDILLEEGQVAELSS